MLEYTPPMLGEPLPMLEYVTKNNLSKTLVFGPKVHNPDAPKHPPVGGYLGWVRVETANVAKTGRFCGKKYTFARILCLQRVGSRKIWSKNRLFC
jgi:hypothetical protein